MTTTANTHDNNEPAERNRRAGGANGKGTTGKEREKKGKKGNGNGERLRENLFGTAKSEKPPCY
jgi:hypothetical protein